MGRRDMPQYRPEDPTMKEFYRIFSCGRRPSGIRGTKVVNPKVRNLCPSKSFPPNSFERRLMPARNPIARKQKRPFTRNRHLTFECFNGERSERNFGDTVRSLRIRYSDHRILQIHLVLRYRSQFLVGPQPGLCNDLNDVPQILRTVGFDPFLLKPCNALRTLPNCC